MNNLIDPLERDVDCIRKFLLRKIHWCKKIFPQDFSRMGWFSICGYPNHILPHSS